MRNLYALLVGIDRYLPPVPALDGCVNDMHSVRDYLYSLEGPSSYSLKMEILENEEATRLNIVRKFEHHLTQAGENDMVFFYYSGHGSQEPAHEVFWQMEPDKMNETLVCYDSRLPDGMDLADKELATLLDMVAQRNPHITVIMDCCNSGSGTRSLGPGEPGPVFKNRSVTSGGKARSLDSYILPKKEFGTRAITENASSAQLVLPKARHVQLAGAQSFEEAKETYLGGSPRGVFTYSMMEVLSKANTPLTYRDLLRRVRNLVTQRTFNQVPQLYTAVTDDENLLFLDGMNSRQSGYFSLYYDQKKRQFAIDGGGAHGIPTPVAGQPTTELLVFADDADDAEMNDPNFAMGSVQVTSVSPAVSWVFPDAQTLLDANTQYRARISSLPVPPMKVFFRGDNPQAVDLLRQAYAQDAGARVMASETARPEEASYWVIARSQPAPHYLLARPLDEVIQNPQPELFTEANKQYRPLVRQVAGFSASSAAEAINQVEHIARWTRLLELENPSSFLPQDSLRIELYDPFTNQIILPGPDGHVFSYYEANGPEQYPQFKIKAINGTGKKLFALLLYFSPDFGADPGLIAGGGAWIEPGAEVWGLEGQPVAGYIPQAFVDFGVKSQRSYLKLILSTSNLDTAQMSLPALGEPLVQYRSRGTEGGMTSRSLMFASPAQRGGGEDWNANSISITIRRED